MRRWLVALAAGVFALSLSACSPELSWPDQPNSSAPGSIALNASTSIGQTVLALEAGLDGVDIYLSPQDAGAGDIQLELLPAPQTDAAGAVLATAHLPASAVTAPGYYHFPFPPQPDSHLHSYYLRLSDANSGSVLIGHGPAESYLQGALYRNDGPDDGAQMAFRLSYAAANVATGVAQQMLTWLGWLVLAVLLFVIPGWALLAWLWPKARDLSWGEQLGLAIGFSLPMYPVLILWTNLVGLRLWWLYAALPVLAGLVVLAWSVARRWHVAPPRWRWPDWRSPNLAPDLAFIGVVALVFFTRLWVGRNLLGPLWGDSYQHTVITQLIINNGGLFNSWLPFAELQSFTYHFGFHTLAAVFHWLSGLDAPDAVLVTGQILNGLSVIVLYPLAVRISHQRWAGVGAVLLAGLLSPMPMAYVNWGRYTQLAGQTILPAAVLVAWAFFEARPRLDWRLLALAWITWGGLALTHYRILIFAVLFAAAFWLVELFARRGRAQLVRTAWLGIGSAALFLPWFIHSFAGGITLGFAKELSTPAGETSAFTQQYNSLGDLVNYLPAWIWLLVIIAIAWGLWRRERGVVVLGAWWGLMLLATNPQWLGLPGEGAISNFALLIAAYLPAGVIVGAGLGWLQAASGSRRILDFGFVALLAVVAVWGARQRLGNLDEGGGALVTAPDLRAAAWIETHTPADSGFLVNAFSAYGGGTVVGSDAGWWLPVLAQRQTSLPPLNYGVETGPRPDYLKWINALPAELAASGINAPVVLQDLRDRHLGYVFIGQRRGLVNNPGQPVLDAGQLVTSDHYHLIYHEDRVWVFQIVP